MVIRSDDDVIVNGVGGGTVIITILEPDMKWLSLILSRLEIFDSANCQHVSKNARTNVFHRIAFVCTAFQTQFLSSTDFEQTFRCKNDDVLAISYITLQIPVKAPFKPMKV